jgi:hypothetical protein
MRASELITVLQGAVAVVGDLEVVQVGDDYEYEIDAVYEYDGKLWVDTHMRVPMTGLTPPGFGYKASSPGA